MRKQTKEIKHQTTNKHGHAEKCKNITPIVIEKKNNSKRYKQRWQKITEGNKQREITSTNSTLQH